MGKILKDIASAVRANQGDRSPSARIHKMCGDYLPIDNNRRHPYR